MYGMKTESCRCGGVCLGVVKKNGVFRFYAEFRTCRLKDSGIGFHYFFLERGHNAIAIRRYAGSLFGKLVGNAAVPHNGVGVAEYIHLVFLFEGFQRLEPVLGNAFEKFAKGGVNLRVGDIPRQVRAQSFVKLSRGNLPAFKQAERACLGVFSKEFLGIFHAQSLVGVNASETVYIHDDATQIKKKIFNHSYRSICCKISKMFANSLGMLNFVTESSQYYMEKIDNLDRKILEIVMSNARIPSKDVAIECGVSRAAIHQRIQRMIDTGVITGSGYHVNPKALGYRTCTYIGVNLESGSMYRQVVPELEKIPEVVECHFTTGPYSMLIKLYARDNEHLMELLNGKIQTIPGVKGTETLISLDHSIVREMPVHYNP